MKRDWKLLLIGVVSAVGAAAIFFAGTDRYASAAPGATTATLIAAGQVDVSTIFSDDTQPASITATLPAGGTVTSISTVSCSPNECGGSVSGNTANLVFTNVDSVSNQISVTLRFVINCPVGGTVYFTSTQGTSSVSNQILCSGTGTGAVGGIIINPTTSIVGCGGSVVIPLTVSNVIGGGYVVDGTFVGLQTTYGIVTPSVTTIGGNAIFTYTAPASGPGGSAVITASASGYTGSQTIVVSPCSSATTPPVITIPTSPPAAPVIPPPVPVSIISPPSTGDGGLLTESNSWTTLAAGVALLAVSLVSGTAGLVAVRNKRS